MIPLEHSAILLALEHSAILLTFIKLPFVIKIFICLFLRGRFTQVVLYLRLHFVISQQKDMLWILKRDGSFEHHKHVKTDG